MTLPRIGVFDSGVGGLTVLKAMAEQIPAHYLYFGDTARLPYGTKSAAVVTRYAQLNAAFLTSLDVKLLVVACNTASAVALVQTKLAPGESTDGAVFLPLDAKALGAGHLQVRTNTDVFDFNGE